METKSQIPSDWILQEYNSRKSKNPSYSLRAFALYLNIPVSRLSEILSQKRAITRGTAVKISERLMWDPKIKSEFLQTVEMYQPKKSSKRNISAHSEVADNYQQLTADTFFAICEWQHFAILSLVETRDFTLNETVIAKRLGIDRHNVRSAIERLQRLGLIEISKGKLKKSDVNLTTTHDIQSAALRKGHKQILEKAIQSLDNANLMERDITAMTMAIDPKKIPKAKEMIKKFRRELCAYLEDGTQTEVYSLGVQLFPLSKKTETK